MTASLLLLTSLAGGLGAVCRLVLDGMIRSGLTPHSGSPAEQTRTLPWPTITINLSGSLVLGVVVGLTLSSTLPSGWDVVVGSGFLGGFTTFSTACVEAVRLAQAGRWAAAAATAFGVLLAGTAAAGLGMWAGALVV
ncbi:MAG: fluoride efflux transporter FluC [Brevibacterium yomogidense]|uniref:fluoride efflux transporter FluC n=1 Tax=Brevibacterium sp. Mu109 TaxID=1255669 RepID=UPI000C3C2A65|nr:CrcB family protein [Brevibacterium sp. Mu109]SMX84553.1 CrcB protein [Brevibacterium sp. Mu109]